ncbi:hypothetical protein EDB86DRAFT_3247970 [Lactarius hatsudake]|nr:hypothetical protein EDB86DRAFT_3247970 [Lactarius hatsudake]
MIHPTRLLPAGFQLALLLATVPSMSAYYTYPKFIGCIKDDSLGSATYTDPAHLTLSNCAYFCWDRNYLWAGVKNGKDCYCIGVKDYPPDDAFVSSDKCNVKCTGDSNVGESFSRMLKVRKRTSDGPIHFANGNSKNKRALSKPTSIIGGQHLVRELQAGACSGNNIECVTYFTSWVINDRRWTSIPERPSCWLSRIWRKVAIGAAWIVGWPHRERLGFLLGLECNARSIMVPAGGPTTGSSSESPTSSGQHAIPLTTCRERRRRLGGPDATSDRSEACGGCNSILVYCEWKGIIDDRSPCVIVDFILRLMRVTYHTPASKFVPALSELRGVEDDGKPGCPRLSHYCQWPSR